MAPKKKFQAKKTAAGGRSAAKPSTAAVKKAAPKKPAAKAPATGHRADLPKRKVVQDREAAIQQQQNEQPPSQPTRTARKPRAAAQIVEEEGVGEDQLAAPPKQRPARRKRATSSNGEDEPPALAPPPRTTRTKRPAASGPDDDDDGPLINRTKRVKAAHQVEETSDGEQQDAETTEQQGENEDSARNFPDIDLRDGDQLAEVEMNNVHFTQRDAANVTLRFRLQVYRDSERAARLFYRLRFYLRAAGENEPTEAGYIHAYRIAKSTDYHRNAESEAWLRDFIPKNVNNVRHDLRETANCLRALFTLQGTPAAGKKVRDANIRRSLARNALLFIQMIHVRQRFQQRGLLTPLLEHW